MEKVKIGIVEDEVLIAHHITSALTKLGYEVLPPAHTYNNGLKLLAEKKPDIMLLDVQLGSDKDGVDLAGIVKQQYKLPVIFITGNADVTTVKRARLVSPSAYLVKPFTKEDLYAAIEIALYNFAVNKPGSIGEGDVESNDSLLTGNCLLIKDGQRLFKIPFAQIRYLQSENVYVTVYTAQQKYLVRGTLTEQEEKLDPVKFMRIHRSYIVNMSFAKSIDGEFVYLDNEKLPIGKTYKDAVWERFNA